MDLVGVLNIILMIAQVLYSAIKSKSNAEELIDGLAYFTATQTFGNFAVFSIVGEKQELYSPTTFMTNLAVWTLVYHSPGDLLYRFCLPYVQILGVAAEIRRGVKIYCGVELYLTTFAYQCKMKTVILASVIGTIKGATSHILEVLISVIDGRRTNSSMIFLCCITSTAVALDCCYEWSPLGPELLVLPFVVYQTLKIIGQE